MKSRLDDDSSQNESDDSSAGDDVKSEDTNADKSAERSCTALNVYEISGDNNENNTDIGKETRKRKNDGDSDQVQTSGNTENPNGVQDQNVLTTKKRKVHKLSMAQTEDFNAKLKRRGVIYVARVPPKMTPSKIKKLLQEVVGKKIEVTRVFLVEEDAAVRKRRRKEHGGNGSKRYVEGWVEFSSKKAAKHLAMSLNNTPISIQPRNAHFGDLWCLKYLPKFQWSHLTEKVAYERRVKEQKLRLETLQARKETAAYKQLVETGKKLDKIEIRRQRKRNFDDDGTTKTSGGGTGAAENTESENKLFDNKKRKKIKQIRPMDDGASKSIHKSLLGSLV